MDDQCLGPDDLHDYLELQDKTHEEYLSELYDTIQIVKNLYNLQGKESEPYKHLLGDTEESKQEFAFQRIAMYFMNKIKINNE